MTSRDHLRAAARCWEHAGFYEEAAERFTATEAWRDAGRCFSQAERHSDAALAYSRADEPLLEAREHLMAGCPERARSLYERLRSERSVPPSTQIEVLLGLGEVEQAIRVTFTSGDREAAAWLARLSSTRGRPDLAASGCPEVSFAPWNRSLRWQLSLPAAEAARIWPSTQFSEVSLVAIWETAAGGAPSWGDRALDWSPDGTLFIAALSGKDLARGRIGPEGVFLERKQLPAFTYCTRFVPASQAVVAGLEGGDVSIVEKNGSVKSMESLHMPNNVLSITFAPEGDRVAVAANMRPGALLKVSSWHAGQVKAQLDEPREPENSCQPLAAWSPDGRRFCWSPGPSGPNRLFFLGQPSLEAHTDQITSLAFTGDSRFLISASLDETIVLRDGDNGQSIAPAERFAARVYGAAVHPRAALVAVGEGDRLHLLRLHPEEVHRLSRLSKQSLDDDVRSLAFSPDGCHLLVMTVLRLHLFRVDLKP